MRRPWVWLSAIVLVIILHALFPRYAWYQALGPNGLVLTRVDRWPGVAEMYVSPHPPPPWLRISTP